MPLPLNLLIFLSPASGPQSSSREVGVEIVVEAGLGRVRPHVPTQPSEFENATGPATSCPRPLFHRVSTCQHNASSRYLYFTAEYSKSSGRTRLATHLPLRTSIPRTGGLLNLLVQVVRARLPLALALACDTLPLSVE